MVYISSNLGENISYIKERFKNCDDIVMREFKIGVNNDILLYMIYTDNIVNSSVIENSIMTNLMNRSEITAYNLENMLTRLTEQIITVGEIKKVQEFEDLFTAVLLGDTILLMDKNPYALEISTKGWPSRGVPEANMEVVVQGPKDAFCENVATNIVLIRRRIRDTNLKVKRKTIGARSKTNIAVLYIDDIVRKEVLDEVEKRLDSINIDAILDSGMLEQLTEDNWRSPFPQLQMTERPDKTAASLLEGRIAIAIDNSPYSILLPTTLNVFFQASEDYYDRWGIVSLIRAIRYVAAAVGVLLPGLYIALTTYHPSMLPTSLALKIAGSRINIPFPTVVEVLIMEISFELLREAGIRLPSPVSSTIGIVGGIIIGSAAVEAGIVSPSVVIVASLTAISSFVMPYSSLISGIRLSKYLIIILSSIFGLYGSWLGIFIILIHLSGLQSFGIPYLYPYCSGGSNNRNDLKDSIVRVPLIFMKIRPIFSNPGQKNRMSINNKRGGKEG